MSLECLVGAKPLSEQMLEHCQFGPFQCNFEYNNFCLIKYVENLVCKVSSILSRPQCVNQTGDTNLLFANFRLKNNSHSLLTASNIVCHYNDYDDVIKWKHIPRNWPFVRGIHRSPHKGQWRGALMFSLICAWINRWVNNRKAGDLRRYHAHYDVIVMIIWVSPWRLKSRTQNR